MFSLRPSDYVLLPTNVNSVQKSYTRRYVFVALLFLLSFALNLYFFIRPAKWAKTPLDNYQDLNNLPLVDTSVLESIPLLAHSPPDPNPYAIVTTLYTDDFAAAVATLGHSLRQSNSTARLLLLYFPDRISASSLCIATSSGFEPHPVDRIAPPHNGKGVYHHFVDQFTKLQLWRLDEELGVKALVYLDADTLVKRNFDELFRLPFNFAAAPDVYDNYGFTLGFNAGVLFLRPSNQTYHSLVDQISTAKFPPNQAEQSYLNHYFGAEVVRLPLAYNANLAIKVRKIEVWEGIEDEIRIVHFTLRKPFIGKKYEPVAFADLEKYVANVATEEGGLYEDEMKWWLGVFRDMKGKNWERLEECFRMA